MAIQVIEIQRDYTHGMLTQFDEAYPDALLGKITPEEYRRTIEQINEYFKEAETIDSTTIIEGCLGCLSLFTLFLCRDDKYKKTINRFNEYLAEQNETVYRPRGVALINPFSNGLLHIDLWIEN
eukprot:TRINITY_DN7656_c0_g1_i1.p1 TRINITY_DN7656_c0_g1~~TRINITY_DN7656_c0_g1_i1.p1  ORF type:complete len:124 (+),score=31.25 TRINITY_DN7656_c0_g1_i1:91-462(+)